MISVIIPVKNRLKELVRAIDSVIHQTTNEDLELIVVDDKSTNDVRKIVDSYKDSRIFYVLNNKEVSNANVCRNLGIKLAKGNYIAMLDSDDEWLPNHLEKKIKFLMANNCDGVFGSYCIDDGKTRCSVISRDFLKGEKIINYLLSDGRAATPTQVYKASAAKKIIWDESLFRHQDWDFSIQFAEKYSFLPSQEMTCIVHWRKGVKRNQDIDSQIAFINKHKKNIDPRIYNNYHKQIYFKLISEKFTEKKHLEYFKKESCRYIKYVTLSDYLTLNLDNLNLINRLFLRFKYIIKKLFV